MATATDEVFGNLTAALKSRGLYDNTIVIVISDNGGPPAKYVEEKTRCVCVCVCVCVCERERRVC